MSKIYLDYAATTPVDARVLCAMQPYFGEQFGNAGSLHSFGQEAIAAVDRAREAVARAVGARFREVIFASSATEANNLALRGVVKSAKKSRILISAIEHESVLEMAWALAREGVEALFLPVDRHGVVNLKKLKENLTANTALVSVMYVNNEVGTIQPIKEISEIIKNFRTQHPAPGAQHLLFHTDAAQAFNYLDCDVAALGVDLITLSSHKIYGPKGVAALCGAGIKFVKPIISGGGQEFGIRSGTENVPAIVGFAKAIEFAQSAREEESKRVVALCEYFGRGLKKICPKAEVNGITNYGLRIKNPQSTTHNPQLSPHILNVYFPGQEAQDILTRLDLAGIAASSGSACRSRAPESSYVIKALGHSKARAKSSVRFSFGRQTTRIELDSVLKVAREILR